MSLINSGHASPHVPQDIPQGASIGWKVKFEGSDSNPIIVDSTLYIGSLDGALYAFDIHTGRPKWSTQTGEGLKSGTEIIKVPAETDLNKQIEIALSSIQKGKKEINATPVFDKETLYVGSGDFSFYAMDAKTGKTKWEYPTKGAIYKTAQVSESSVFVLSDDGLLHAVDKQTGMKKWDHETFPNARESPPNTFPFTSNAMQPSRENGLLFVSNWVRGQPFTTYFYAIQADSGKTGWKLSFDGWDVTEPVISEGIALLAFETRNASPFEDYVKLYAIDATAGNILWEFQHQKISGFKAVATSKDLAFLETDNTLYALDIKTGEIRWQFDLEPKVSGLLYHKSFHIDGDVYVMNKGQLYALDMITGKEKWSLKQGGKFSIVQITAPNMYLMDNKSIQAIDLSTGKKSWGFTSKTPITTELLFHQDKIYFATKTSSYVGMSKLDQGYLYALDRKTGKINSR
ncbi:outer membrane protein assembly factor BamB family protein [Echinicola sediminis]